MRRPELVKPKEGPLGSPLLLPCLSPQHSVAGILCYLLLQCMGSQLAQASLPSPGVWLPIMQANQDKHDPEATGTRSLRLAKDISRGT